MAGIPSYAYFLEELRKLYTTKKCSDVLLEIFEEDGTERHLYSRISVHSVVLNMSSSCMAVLVEREESPVEI